MIFKSLPVFFALLSVTVYISIGQTSSNPNVFSLDARLLQYSKLQLKLGNPALQKSYEALLKKGNEALNEGPFSVVSKEKTPPGGNKHDYMSMGPYWWPNPKTANGLPYIRKDGERNPETKKFEDRENIRNLIAAVNTLSLSYYFSDHLKYAERAALLLKVWFLNPETRMNPHLNYGQCVPGITDGRAEGLIETTGLIEVIDGIGLIKNSGALTASELASLKNWFAEFLTWITKSEIGKDEIAAKNNHGTWCDVQSVAYALFTDQPYVARKIIETRGIGRIKTQIRADGGQPRELARTVSWGYSNMNLRAFFILANLAKNVNIDLFNYQSNGFTPIHQALNFLVPYLKGEKKWETKQIKPMEYDNTCFSLRMGTLNYHVPVYEQLITKYDESKTTDVPYLLWPLVKSKPITGS